MATLQTRNLQRFVDRKDAAYRVLRTGGEIRMTSQRWKGTDWKHEISQNWPTTKMRATGTAILIITGDRVEPADGNYAQKLADLSGLKVYTLFNIPNQPLFGKREDDLIAHSYEQFLQTGDADWPLLFPMVKAAKQAMNAIQQVSIDPPKNFIVTGASKRGWTTWLLAACQDKRIAAIAPAVFDNLSFEKQLARQKELWGGYSEMIADYAEKGLLEVLKTPRGMELVAMVDPWAYRKSLTLPKLIISGSNDRYWPTDATSLYWRNLLGPKSAYISPNHGHNTGNLELRTLAAFSLAIATGQTWPSIDFTKTGLNLSWSCSAPLAQRVWIAESQSLDFRSTRWKATPLSKSVRSWPIRSKTKHVACFVEVDFSLGGIWFSLSTERRILR